MTYDTENNLINTAWNTWIPLWKFLWKRVVTIETRKNCVPRKVPHQNIRWNFGILGSASRWNYCCYSKSNWLTILSSDMNTKVTKIYLSSSFVDYWLEWLSGLRRYIPNRKDLSWKHTSCSAGLWDTTSLRGCRWPSRWITFKRSN